MVDAEGVQLLVAFVYVGVAAAREITTMNVGSGQRVADAGAGIKIGLQDFPLFRCWQFRKRLGRSVSECAADAYNGLKFPGRVDKDTDLGFQWLAQRFEDQRFSRGEPVISFVSRGIDRDLSSFDLNGLRGFKVLSVCRTR